MSTEPRTTDNEPAGLDGAVLELCPICWSSHRVTLRADWQRGVDLGQAIPIVGCGNPWHYANLAAERASGGLEWRRLAWAMWVAEDVERLGVPFLAWWNDAGNQRHVMRVWLEVNNFGPDAEAIAARLTGGQDDE